MKVSGQPDYDAKHYRKIDAVDPGAVPGGSTIKALRSLYDGAETGSTRVAKANNGFRYGSAVIGPSM
jgi:hypothetical protein